MNNELDNQIKQINENIIFLKQKLNETELNYKNLVNKVDSPKIKILETNNYTYIFDFQDMIQRLHC